jgi:hypothetical protein
VDCELDRIIIQSVNRKRNRKIKCYSRERVTGVQSHQRIRVRTSYSPPNKVVSSSRDLLSLHPPNRPPHSSFIHNTTNDQLALPTMASVKPSHAVCSEAVLFTRFDPDYSVRMFQIPITLQITKESVVALASV